MASTTFQGFNLFGGLHQHHNNNQQQQQQHQHDSSSPPLIGGDAATAAGRQQQPQHPQQPQPAPPSAAAEIRRITAQYDREAARLAEQLSFCGIQQQHLTEEAQGHVKVLAAAASLLQLTQAQPQLVLAAWALLLVQESKATKLHRALQRELAELGQQRAKARAKLALLQRVLADVQARQAKEAGRAHDKTRLAEQMQAKDQGYQAAIAKASRRLEAAGFKPELTHAALLEQHERLQGLRAQLDDQAARLAGYHALPASLLGARMKLEEAKRALEEKHIAFQAQLAG